MICSSYFNSSMVRLRGGKGQVVRSPLSNFNSSMVRLRGLVSMTAAFSTGFQFQYGAIKGLLHHNKNGSKSYFNSSMVRLREWYGNDSNSTGIFQFQYGAIKGGVAGTIWIGVCLNFNSSMVRLRDFAAANDYRLIWYFNSSMVRLRALSLFRHFPCYCISIPVWCD